MHSYVNRSIDYNLKCMVRWLAWTVFTCAMLLAGFGALFGHADTITLPLLGMGAIATQQATVPAVPFSAASHRHVELAFTLTVTPGAGVTFLNPIDNPATGYMRHLLLEVTYTNGTVGVLNADGPSNVFQTILLQDVNGSNIFGPIDGYAAGLCNMLGGHAFKVNEQVGVADPATVLTGPNPVFSLRIPLEVSQKSGLGSISNQNSANQLKLTLAINSETAITSTPWTVDPTVTIRGWIETWTVPAETDANNNVQMQVPPLFGTGMFHSSRSKAISVGDNTVEFTRLGNLIRWWLFIARTAGGVRDSTVFPDPVSFNWDGNAILSRVTQRYLRTILNEAILNSANFGALPAGVFAIPFDFATQTGGRLGDEDPDGWLPTTQSGRLEINGNAATAGTVQVVTCEVAPFEVDTAEKQVQPNATGSLMRPTVSA